MKRVDMSLKNKRVKVYFAIMLPLILLAIILNLVLPIELQSVSSLTVVLGLISYLIWLVVDKKKEKN